MDLKQMRYFLAVAEERHMGRAAERLHMAQPPLTRQIHALEAELGAALFTRTPKGMELTGAGQTLLDEVPNLLQLAQRARERTRAAGRGETGRLDVGLFGSGVLDVIPRLLARFHAERPDVQIVLHTMTKAEQLEALRERRISVGLSALRLALAIAVWRAAFASARPAARAAWRASRSSVAALARAARRSATRSSRSAAWMRAMRSTRWAVFSAKVWKCSWSGSALITSSRSGVRPQRLGLCPGSSTRWPPLMAPDTRGPTALLSHWAMARTMLWST